MFNTYESGIWRLKSIFERLNNDTPLYIFLTTKWNITIFFLLIFINKKYLDVDILSSTQKFYYIARINFLISW